MYFPLRQVAVQLGIPYADLKARADRGEVPVHRTQRRVLADPVAVRKALEEAGGASRRYSVKQLAGSRETAKYLGVTDGELTALAEGGVVPAFRVGRAWGFDKEQVCAVLLRAGGAERALKELRDAQANAKP